MSGEFKSFYKTVGGNEGGKCKYNTRLDTYGKGCSHDCSYCVDPDTLVLMYDGTHKKIKDIEIGDEIYGVREGERYKELCKSVVLNKVSSIRNDVYKITLYDGTELICSGEHRWLSNRGWKYTTGSMGGYNQRPYLTNKNSIFGFKDYDISLYDENDDYKKGYISGIWKGDGLLRLYDYSGSRRRKEIQYASRLTMKDDESLDRVVNYSKDLGIEVIEGKFKNPCNGELWREVRTKNSETSFMYLYGLVNNFFTDSADFARGFLAGIYDSEGSSGYVKRISNTDINIVEITEYYLSMFGFKFVREIGDEDRKLTLYNIRILGGLSEFVRFSLIVNPAIKRKWKFDNICIKGFNSEGKTIKSIEPVEGEFLMYDITTSTENFIANGCVSHNCYAKSLLSFRGMWDSESPAIADIDKIRKTIKNIKKKGDVSIVRLGGMTDCFQPIEVNEKVTYETIKCLNENRIEYLIVTKSDLVASDEYINILDKDLAHIQITVTTTNDELSKTYEKAVVPSRRIKAIEKLQERGFDVALRLSPFIDEYIDYDILNNVKCDKIQVEFLRVNSWIEKWFDIDYSNFTVKQSNYKHLPLDKKKELISKITGFKYVSVCEDESDAYEYWKNNFNPNPDDCCNLRR